MKNKLAIPVLILFIITGCISAPPAATLSSTATPTEVKILPTPSTAGDTVTWQDVRVVMDNAEITNSFMTDFGTRRQPSAGQKFLWVHVILENTGQNEIALPAAENFSVLYADSEFKPTYGHRQDYPDYTDLNTPLYPGQGIAAWLRFDIPETAQLREMQFVFMPESVQVGVSPTSPDYPWGGEHPVFIWAYK